MSKDLKTRLLTEDWAVTIFSIPLLIIAAFAAKFPFVPKVPNTLLTADAWLNIGIFFVLALITLYTGNKYLSRPLKGLLASFIVVFILALIAQFIANIGIVKEFGFEAVFFSVLIGLLIGNTIKIPDWMKPAIQGEFYIKIGVVCLGATILFRDVMKSGFMGLVQALIVVAAVWFFAFFISKLLFKVDDRTAMTLSSGVSICGVSACITAAGVAGTDKKKLSYITSMVLIIVVPMIYLMPWLAKMIVPLLTDDVVIQQEIAGAWIGGTIDTTSGVTASSGLYSEAAQSIAVIVKATQNVLIGVVAFFIALYLSTRSNSNDNGKPSLGIVWEKFPKFIIGFVLASAVFSLLQANGIFSDAEAAKPAAVSMAKGLSTFFFSLAFVCIGLDTKLKDIVSKENRNVLSAFLCAQVFNIVFTFIIAYLLFGIVKPMLA
ncbi:MAG: putative sulfate exporter family transporter [Bacteroidales bacterium]|nr:putative sulfate exporter family transporter [Bacteroidales bacterium]